MISRTNLSKALMHNFPQSEFPWIGADVQDGKQRFVVDYKNCDLHELAKFCSENWPDVQFYYFDKS